MTFISMVIMNFCKIECLVLYFHLSMIECLGYQSLFSLNVILIKVNGNFKNKFLFGILSISVCFLKESVICLNIVSLQSIPTH